MSSSLGTSTSPLVNPAAGRLAVQEDLWTSPSSTIEGKLEIDEDDSLEQNNPVNLIKRTGSIKSETASSPNDQRHSPPVSPGNHHNSPYSSTYLLPHPDLLAISPLPNSSPSYFARRRRRGRAGRYTPFFIPSEFPLSRSLTGGLPLTLAHSNNTTSLSNSNFATKLSSLNEDHVVGGSKPTTNHQPQPPHNRTPLGHQFTCPNCPALFSNRDALAMHMMDSVRSGQGCPGHAMSNRSKHNSTSTALSPPPAPTTPRQHNSGTRNSSGSSNVSNNSPVLGNNNNNNNNSSSNTTNTLNGTHLRIPPLGLSPSGVAQLSPPGQQHMGLYSCRMCGERKTNLDSLAMHMLGHVHQQQDKEQGRHKPHNSNDPRPNDPRPSSQTSDDTDNSMDKTVMTNGQMDLKQLPTISPQYFSALDFTNMQHAFSLAMATINAKTAASTTPIIANNHMNNIIREESKLDTSLTPPKCRSVPLAMEMDRANHSSSSKQHQQCSSNSTPPPDQKMEYCGEELAVETKFNLLQNSQLPMHSNTIHRNKRFNSQLQGENTDSSAGVNEKLNDMETQPSTEQEIEANFPLDRVSVPFYFACRHCRITFEDRTMYCLHMGLHNVNNPWQCNMCGKVCPGGRHEFASHSLHF